MLSDENLSRPFCLICIFCFYYRNLHFTSRKIQTKKQQHTHTNKITQSPDANIPESAWEYKITNNNNKYIYKKESC